MTFKSLFCNLVLALVLLPSYVFLGASDPKADAAYKQGLEMEKARDTQGALWNFRLALSIDPQMAPALHQAGNMSYLLKDYKKALDFYDRYLEVKPEDKTIAAFRPQVQAMLDAGADMDHGLLKWRSIEAGLKESAETGKPLLYDMTAAWCGPCKRLVAEVFSKQEYADVINKEFIPVQVVDRKRENGFNPKNVASLHSQYEVDVYPTLIVTLPGGRPERTMGYGDPGSTMAFLVEALGKTKGLQKTGYEGKYPQE